MDIYQESLKLHKKLRGKLSITPKLSIKSSKELSLLYTPGVAEACRLIHQDESRLNELTFRNNLVAIVSDGSAVLGLGNIGAKAAMPVMEGKAVLFKEFGGVDAMPLCIDTQDTERIIDFIKLIVPTVGGINLEDISSPRCFEIEERLRKEIDIPVFHDDQHGTAIVVGGALRNALRIVGKSLDEVKIVVNGIGSAGSAISRFLINMGAKRLKLCDINGILNPDDLETCLHRYHTELARMTNPESVSGNIHDALKEADVFIGISVGDLLTEEDIKNMNPDSIIFAMANPTPEIDPELAKKAGARIIATGRSDYPNQVNNVLAFPGIFRGAFEVDSRAISEQMKIDASKALADYVLNPDENYIIPNPLDKMAVVEVAMATAESSMREGLARHRLDEGTLRQNILRKIIDE
jgi:malate dehydrogenase (oxaloacetate-decarboxylating)